MQHPSSTQFATKQQFHSTHLHPSRTQAALKQHPSSTAATPKQHPSITQAAQPSSFPLRPWGL
eukprot:8674285-Lingulodinium_polyedra.AAC.1